MNTECLLENFDTDNTQFCKEAVKFIIKAFGSTMCFIGNQDEENLKWSRKHIVQMN